MKDNNEMALRKSVIRCWTHANPNADLEGRKTQLVDFLVKEFPQITRGGHRGLVNRMEIFESCEHECPKCHVVHKGLATIAAKCGLRFIKDRGENGKYYFQSWCHDCRCEGARKSKEDPTYGVRINSANADCVVFTN